MSLIPAFPSTNSIPPESFYNIQGLAQWLNDNPTFKQYFVDGSLNISVEISSLSTSLSSISYDPLGIQLCSDITTITQSQLQQYTQQIKLFRNIYSYNSNAYVDYINGNTLSPIYYTFKSYQEHIQYKSAVSLINTLYPFQEMANRVGWIVPFPIYM